MGTGQIGKTINKNNKMETGPYPEIWSKDRNGKINR